MATKFNDGRIAKGKLAHRVLECWGTGALKWVRRAAGGWRHSYLSLTSVFPNEKLYIILHGLTSVRNVTNAGAMNAGMVRNAPGSAYGQMRPSMTGIEKRYTAAELAAHCEQEGLNKAHLDLRLFVCSAGVPVPPPEGRNRSFAWEFREAMRRLGYGPLRVTAYLGDLVTGYNNVWTSNPALPRMPTDPDMTAERFKGVQKDNGGWQRASERHVVFP